MQCFRKRIPGRGNSAKLGTSHDISKGQKEGQRIMEQNGQGSVKVVKE